MWLFIKNLLFTLVLPGTIAVYIPLGWIVRDASWPERLGIQHVAGLVLIAIGAVIYFRCLWEFAVVGRATPAPIDAPRFVVRSGPFRYVRNPFYIGVVTFILGEAVFFGTWSLVIYAAIVALGFHLFVLIVEEPSLERQFGEAYLHYKKAVRRWIPGSPYSPNS
jgi:protein-S-isoprenylcysteine O-methyltransferase Ste14